MAENLAAIDIRILDQLQRDASLSTTELAERVGTSQSPCWRRVQRLKDEGYIERQVALLDRDRLGLDLVIFAALKISKLSTDERAAFEAAIVAQPAIVECHTMFGETDVMMKIVAPTMHWYRDFVFETLSNLPGVVDIQSMVTLSEMKYETGIPIRGTLAL